MLSNALFFYDLSFSPLVREGKDLICMFCRSVQKFTTKFSEVGSPGVLEVQGLNAEGDY